MSLNVRIIVDLQVDVEQRVGVQQFIHCSKSNQ